MGCCFSKQQQPASSTLSHFPEKSPVPESDPRLQVARSESPHPHPADDAPPIEEETVKEVLSETPKPTLPKVEEEEEEKIEKKVPVVINGSDEISDVSDLCSLSESVSTTTITDKKCDEADDGEVEMQRRENRSPAKFHRKRFAPGDFSGRCERGRRSPAAARRSEQSPARRTPGREACQTNRARMPSGSNGIRRDAGEYSGRRSRSPATRAERNAATGRSDLGRSQSARKTVRSPARIQSGLPEDGGRRLMERDEEDGRPANESLENPLVSLECFIFL